MSNNWGPNWIYHKESTEYEEFTKSIQTYDWFKLHTHQTRAEYWDNHENNLEYWEARGQLCSDLQLLEFCETPIRNEDLRNFTGLHN